MSSRLRTCSMLLLLGVLASVPALGGSAVVGSVAGSLNATVGGQAVLPHQAIFSGDSLQVKNGALVVATDNGSRMAFGRDTTATFQREARALTVVLSAGNVSLYHADDPVALRVVAGTVTVEPAPGYKTLGDIAMVNGAVVVTAKDGALRVNHDGRTVEVAKGKTIALTPRTARAPQTGGSQKLGGGPNWVEYTILGAAGAAAGFGIGALIRAGDAKDSASLAASNAASAAAAISAAVPTIASNVASAISANNAYIVDVGCALNNFNEEVYGVGTFPSPYTPPPGFSCGFFVPTPTPH